jgi:hypothetical protein
VLTFGPLKFGSSANLRKTHRFTILTSEFFMTIPAFLKCAFLATRLFAEEPNRADICIAGAVKLRQKERTYKMKYFNPIPETLEELKKTYKKLSLCVVSDKSDWLSR